MSTPCSLPSHFEVRENNVALIFAVLAKSLRRLAATACWAMISVAADAATSVSPVIVDANADGRAVVTVVNHRDHAVLYQLSALSWKIIDGQDRYEITQDYIASPPLFTLAAGETQAIRIGFRNPTRNPVERAYRLAIAEVPRVKMAGEEGGTVDFAIQYLLPVYVAAADREAKPELVWSMRTVDDSILLRAENAGHTHIALTAVGLSAGQPGAAEPEFLVKALATILANSWREWRFVVPHERAPQAWRIVVQYQGSALLVTVPDADVVASRPR